MLNREELKTGDIIICSYGKDNYIIEFDNLQDTRSNYIMNSVNFYTNGSFRFKSDCKFRRLAEKSEIVWFKECNLQGRFVAFEDIKFNEELEYEIC